MTGVTASFSANEQSPVLDLNYQLSYYYDNFVHFGFLPLLAVDKTNTELFPDISLGYTIPFSDKIAFDFTLASGAANLPYMLIKQASLATGILADILGMVATEGIRYVSSLHIRDQKNLYSAQVTYFDDMKAASSLSQRVSFGVGFSTFCNF